MPQIDEILKEHGVDFRHAGESHHVSSGWIGLDCCFCGSKGYHLGINLTGGFATCWRCGPHRLHDVFRELKIPSEASRDVLKRRETRERPQGRLEIPKGVGPLRKAHRDYLRSRGFDPAEIERLWGIRGIGLAAALSWRLFIPIHLRGEVVSWTTRSLVDSGVRYVTAKPEQEAVSSRSVLYGEDHARHAIIVHEGPTDVWRTGPGAVCTFGLVYSTGQLLRASKYPTRIICLDSDDEAQKRARGLCEALAVYPGKTVNVVLDAKDAGSASNREIGKLRRLLE